MVKVRGEDSQEGVDFSVDVAATLKDVLACLPTVDRLSKPEVVVIFSYDAHGESLLAPTVFVCDSARTVNIQAFAANSQSRV